MENTSPIGKSTPRAFSLSHLSTTHQLSTPQIQYIPYPKVGTINPAARIGVIDFTSRDISWMPIPGDTRDNYLPRMEWVDEKRLVIQQLNRLQNRLHRLCC
jgi:hypothetical protein